MHDYVIVGAGAAGCVLAGRLTEDPSTSVLLLEAGPRPRALRIRVPAAFAELYRSAFDWGYETEPQSALAGRRVFYPRGRTLGGSTAINAMMVLRGHRADQDAWGVPGWSWADVEPAYAKSVSRFPAAEPRSRSPLTEAFIEAAAAVGLPVRDDLNAPDNEGVGIVRVSQRRGRRFSVADGYLRPAVRRPNLTVVTEARATRVLVDDGVATGVSFRVDGRDEEVRAGREVLVAAGAVDSPKLLLLSGIGPPEDLREHGIPVTVASPGVGGNLRDHVANGVLLGVRAAPTLRTADSPRHVLDWLVRGRGPLTSNVGEAAAFVRTEASLGAPDLELIFAPVLFEEEGLQRPSEDGVTIAAVALQPESVGEVRLRSADPLEPPSIDPRYLSDPEGDDARVLLHGVRLARRIAAAEPLASQLSREILPGAEAQGDEELLAHLRERSQTLYHPVGTCRLGVDPGAVLDPELRVRGVARLRVVDASAIPRLPRGHTSWPTVMVAERAAELLRGAGASGGR